MTLATDWDTEHSLVLAPERTAGMIQSLGFTARQNHYCGALWFYELVNPANVYATGDGDIFGDADVWRSTITVTIGTVGVPLSDIILTKVVHAGDDGGDGRDGVRERVESRVHGAVGSRSSAGVLTIQARTLGTGGDSVSLSASGSATLTATASGSSLTGGVDGNLADGFDGVAAVNRAARDWQHEFLHGAEWLRDRIDGVVQHGAGQWRSVGRRRGSHSGIRREIRSCCRRLRSRPIFRRRVWRSGK